MTRVLGSLMLAGFLCVFGCSRETPKYAVTGEVSWKGEAVEKGDIVFYSEDGESPPESGKVLNGRFAMKVTAGKKIVQLFATKEKPVINKVMGAGERETLFGPEYNAQSSLKVEVTASGSNQFDFHLPQKK